MNIAIVGAGLLGSLLALQLAERSNIKITLYGGDPINGVPSAAMTAAGMLAPFTELEKSPAIIAELGLRSLQLWPAILAKLQQPIYFRRQGALVTAHRQDQQDLQHYLEKISQVAGQACYRQLSKEAIQQMEPDLVQFNQLYYFPEEGQMDNQHFMLAVHAWLRHKISWHPTQLVTNIQGSTVTTTQHKKNYDYVIDCRGLGAKQQFSDLRGVRGEVIWLKAPAVKLTRPVRFLHPRYSIYIVPRPDQIYIVGASEIEAEDYSSISLRSTMELLSAAYSLHKGFIEARIIKTEVNCRPTLANHLPRIRYADSLLAINGLYRHGFILAPALINDVINYLDQGMDAVRYHNLWEKIDVHYPV